MVTNAPLLPSEDIGNVSVRDSIAGKSEFPCVCGQAQSQCFRKRKEPSCSKILTRTWEVCLKFACDRSEVRPKVVESRQSAMRRIRFY